MAEAEGDSGAEADDGAEGQGGYPAEGHRAWHAPLLRGQSAAAGPAQVQPFHRLQSSGTVFGAGWSDDEDEEAHEREQEWAELGTIPHVPDDPDRAYA